MTHAMKTGAALVALLVAAGCSRSVSPFENSGPSPLAPAPAGRVSVNQLPPPPPPPPPQTASMDQMASKETPGDTTDQDNDAANGSDASGGDNGGSDNGATQVASVSSQPLSRNSVLGAYKVTTTGGNCQIILSLTKWSGGYRAASRGCPGKVADVSAWDVSGSQVVLKDNGGSTVASLNSSGGNRYEGQTTGGQQITLYR